MIRWNSYEFMVVLYEHNTRSEGSLAGSSTKVGVECMFEQLFLTDTERYDFSDTKYEIDYV